MEGATFGYLVNRVAFVDTIRLSVWTDKNPIFRQLVDERNDPIGSRRSKYSRRLSGKSPYSGNPTTVLYGRKVRFSSVPPYRMRIDSKEAPVTAAEVNEIIRRIFPDARRVDVSQADITFDLRRESVRQLFRSVMHRARQWTELSNLSGKTIYIGSPRSAWEIRLYNKRSNVVRFEVMLRRPFLSANGIQRPDSVIAVRSVLLADFDEIVPTCIHGIYVHASETRNTAHLPEPFSIGLKLLFYLHSNRRLRRHKGPQIQNRKPSRLNKAKRIRT